MYLGSIEGRGAHCAFGPRFYRFLKTIVKWCISWPAAWLLTVRQKWWHRPGQAVEDYAIGDVVRVLEQNSVNGERLINCQTPPCVFTACFGCRLSGSKHWNNFYQFLINHLSDCDAPVQHFAVVIERTHLHKH